MLLYQCLYITILLHIYYYVAVYIVLYYRLYITKMISPGILLHLELALWSTQLWELLPLPP